MFGKIFENWSFGGKLAFGNLNVYFSKSLANQKISQHDYVFKVFLNEVKVKKIEQLQNAMFWPKLRNPGIYQNLTPIRKYFFELSNYLSLFKSLWLSLTATFTFTVKQCKPILAKFEKSVTCSPTNWILWLSNICKNIICAPF